MFMAKVEEDNLKPKIRLSKLSAHLLSIDNHFITICCKERVVNTGVEYNLCTAAVWLVLFFVRPFLRNKKSVKR